MFIATLVHKPADALTITSLMLRAGSTRWSALLVNFGFGLMIPAGVAFFALGMGGLGSSCGIGVDRRCTGLLGRYFFVHRAIGPVA